MQKHFFIWDNPRDAVIWITLMLLARNFLAKYQRLLGSGGHLRFKTDNRALFDFSVEEFKEFGLEIIALSYDLHHSEYENEVQTEYEQKFSALGTPINFCEVVFK